MGAEVARLKERYSGDILVAGSGRLVRTLLGEGLVDELRLMVFPVILGSGNASSTAPPERPCASPALGRSAPTG